MKKLVPFLALGFLFTGAFAQTNVPALIQSNQVWTKSGSPYIISQTTLIEQGVKVEIEPGVEVKAGSSVQSLIVDGELQALGSKNDRIEISNIYTSFTSKSEDYNANTNTGIFYNYCIIKGDGSIGNLIKLDQTSARITNCDFRDAYYMIYASGGSQSNATIEVDACTFMNDKSKTKQGYAIYGYNTGLTYVVTNSSFEYMRGIYMGGTFTFEKNSVRDFYSLDFYPTNTSSIKCNTFSVINQSIDLEMRSKDTTTEVDFEDNTMDSFTTRSHPMLKFSKSSSIYYGKINCSKNNFLGATPGTYKLYISGYNSNLSSSEQLDFSQNYWGTTDTNGIDSMIYDYKDEITIFGTANYRPFLSVESKPKCKIKSTCKADFYLGIDSSEAFVIYVITKNTGATNTTKYTWDFGDGSTSNKKHTSHFYDSFGLYTLCLTLEDTAKGCYSKICKKIGMDSTGSWLMAQGFSVNIISESQFLSIKNAQKELAFKVFPNPGKDRVNVLMPDARAAAHQLQLLTLSGKTMLAKTINGNRTSFDLSKIPNGVYMIKVSSANQSGTSKIVILR